ncbi:MAG: hypothetical protein NTY66_04265 [Candidatus Vogelbacteria bacterium]|nr:hypothetical protein [Candidatus Vogelbacteria bacterium]
MNDLITWTIISLTVLMTGWYCLQAAWGRIAPTLSTWLIFLVATILQILTYKWASKEHGWFTNVYAITDTIAVGITVLLIFFFGKKVKRRFRRIDVRCLRGAGAVWLVWGFGMAVLPNSSLICNFAIQAIMVLAYFPTWGKLWRAKQKTEPYSVWVVNEFTALLGLSLVLPKHDWISIVYSVRAIVSVLIVLLLLFRLDILAKRNAPPSR